MPPKKRESAQDTRGLADPDALFLPPCVRKARRSSATHWARPENGWRPIVEEPPKVTPLPLPSGLPEESIWRQHHLLKRVCSQHLLTDMYSEQPEALCGEESSEALSRFMDESGDLAVPSEDEAEETLELGPEDEPDECDLLSPEEVEAKSALWNEIHGPLVEMWAVLAKQKKEVLEQKERAREAAQARSAQRQSERESQLSHKEAMRRKLLETREKRRSQDAPEVFKKPRLLAKVHPDDGEEEEEEPCWTAGTSCSSGDAPEAEVPFSLRALCDLLKD